MQTYTAPGITVTFDPNRCMHSAVCVRTLPNVFDVRRKRWVRPEAATAAEVAAAIDRCPSGALQYVLSGEGESEPDQPDQPDKSAPTTIQASSDGPLLVQGSFQIIDEQGRPIDTAGRAALCRCGGSAKRPFCDGSHRRIGFKSVPKNDG